MENQYSTMPIDEIKYMKIPVDDDALLFIFVTSPMLEKKIIALNAWGFAYRTNMVWVKDKIGMG